MPTMRLGGLGLSFGDKKTKILFSGNHQPPNDVLIGQNKLEVIKNLTYLGSSINTWGRMDHEISFKIGKACAAFNHLNTIWRSKKVTIKTKFCCYNPNVLSILLFSCKTWHLKTSQEKKLGAFTKRCIPC